MHEFYLIRQTWRFASLYAPSVSVGNHNVITLPKRMPSVPITVDFRDARPRFQFDQAKAISHERGKLTRSQAYK
jgi:hypothetical protein